MSETYKIKWMDEAEASWIKAQAAAAEAEESKELAIAAAENASASYNQLQALYDDIEAPVQTTIENARTSLNQVIADAQAQIDAMEDKQEDIAEAIAALLDDENLTLDSTLLVEGVPPDSKATGEKITAVEDLAKTYAKMFDGFGDFHSVITLPCSDGAALDDYQSATYSVYKNIVSYNNYGQIAGNYRHTLTGTVVKGVTSKPTPSNKPGWFVDIPAFVVGHKYYFGLTLLSGTVSGSKGEVDFRILKQTGDSTSTELAVAVGSTWTCDSVPKCICINFMGGTGGTGIYTNCVWFYYIIDRTLEAANDASVRFNQTVSGTKNKDISAALPAGIYRFTIDNIESSDTDTRSSRIGFDFGGSPNNLVYNLSRGPLSTVIWLPAQTTTLHFFAGTTAANSTNDTFTFSNVVLKKLEGAEAEQAWKEHIDNGYHELPKNPYNMGLKTYNKALTNSAKVLKQAYKEAVSTTHAHAASSTYLAQLADRYDHVAVSNYYPSAPWYPMEAFYSQVPENFMISPNGEHVHFGSSVSNRVCLNFTGTDGNVHICGVGSFAASDPNYQQWSLQGCIAQIVNRLQFPQAGGATINHPAWSKLTGQDVLDIMQKTNGVFGLEVHHGSTEDANHDPIVEGWAISAWDYVLSQGVQLFGLAVPDHKCEGLDPEAPLADGGGYGYNHCLVRARTEQEILLAYSYGRFYSSNFWFKPESPIDNPADDPHNLLFTELKYNDGVFTVETNKNAVIKFITARSYSDGSFVGAVQTSDGTGNSATYSPSMSSSAKDIFVRVEASASVTDPRTNGVGTVTCTLRSNAVIL